MRGKEQYREDAKALRDAMEGWGTNEEKIIQVTAFRKNNERQEIIKEYKASFGRDAIEDLDDELGGCLCKTVLAMYLTPGAYDAQELHKAISGLGTDDDVLIEILGTRTNDQMFEIKKEYLKKYNVDLEKDVIGDTSGFYQNLLVAILQCNRDSSHQVDHGKIMKDVKDLYDSGENKIGTDEETFIRIFSLRSAEELRSIAAEYLKATGGSLFAAIDSEFSGNVKKLLHTILLGHTNPPEYFAQRIRDACEGLGTKDNQLIRVLVTRDEIDLKEINKIYLRNYKMSLSQQIADETSGDYKKILLALVASD